MNPRAKPSWIRSTIPGGTDYVRLKKSIHDHSLNTVCTEARCPNIGECFGRGTATFLILGKICTRSCGYCSVRKSHAGSPPDAHEPAGIAECIRDMKLNHAVITSVTRDDIEDGGARHFCEVLQSIRQTVPSCNVELLIPDFIRSLDQSLSCIVELRPHIIGHNIEVARNVFPRIRPGSDYDHSLCVLSRISQSGISAKTGIMVGLGESFDDILHSLDDIIETGCRYITIGQYLRPSSACQPVNRYYTPDEFSSLERHALDRGFLNVLSGPLVRSSYRAESFLSPVDTGS